MRIFRALRLPIIRRACIRLGVLALNLTMLGMLSAPVHAQTVTAAVPVGTAPQQLAVNPVTNKFYVLNSTSGTVSIIAGADNSTTTIAVGTSPDAIAIDSLTNKIYVANAHDNTVTVIDGATNATTTVAVGMDPDAIALNPVTNQIYVADYSSGSLTDIDGATNTTTTISVGTDPVAVAVNPATNHIYVANEGSNTATVIDGATNSTAAVGVGAYPLSIAVNPVTNQIYVANARSNDVTVIDGATNTTTTVATGTYPLSIAVNPVTNQIYVANLNSRNVTVIDGATNTPTNVLVGTAPASLAVNAMTNRVYVACFGSNNVLVIDGATNAATTLAGFSVPFSVAENPVTNKIYVANESGNTVTEIDGATNHTTTIAVGLLPNAVAVDPVTNTIYVPNSAGNDVTVIDGASSSTTTIAAGSMPQAVAVNPITDKIYVANSGDNTVTEIDGATNATTPISVGSVPKALAINPVTNKIYVANSGDNTVTVIDGATNATTAPISVGADPVAISVDPVTNQIYVANSGAGTVSVIDGATNVATTLNVGVNPRSVAVDPLTNMIYVANSGDNTVTAINGSTDATATIPVGSQPLFVALNPVTNRIYVANYGDGTVTVIDGGTSATTTVTVGPSSETLAVNPVTDKIYVPSAAGDTVTVIDGATSKTTTALAGSNPSAVAVNPVTNQVYVVNQSSDDDVTVLTEQQVQPIPLTTTIGRLANNQTSNPTPTFTFAASSTFSPTAFPPDAVYFQVDTWQGPWIPATATSTPGTFTGTLPTLALGVHVLYAYAADGQDASSTQMGGDRFTDSSPLVGNIAAYLFVVTNQGSASQIALSSSENTVAAGSTATLTATIEDTSGGVITTGPDSTLLVTFTQTGGNGTVLGLGSATASAGVATLTVTGDLAGSVVISASATSTESVALTEGAGDPTAITVIPGPPTRLAWTTQPTNTTVGQTISPSPQVSVEDQYGNIVVSDTGRSIAIAIATNSAGGTLSGTLTLTDSSGVAAYSDLSINEAGKGYTLAASAQGLTGAASDPFNITPIASTTTIVSNLASIRYSDGGLNLNATITLTFTSGGIPGGSLAFQLVPSDGLACYGGGSTPRVIALGSSNLNFNAGKATATLNGIQISDPCAWSQNPSGNAYTLQAVFTSSNPNYTNSNGSTSLLVTPESALSISYTGNQVVFADSGTSSATATLSAAVVQDTTDGYLVSFDEMNSVPPVGAAAGCSSANPTACRIYVAFQLSGGSGSCGGSTYYAPVYDSGMPGLGVATAIASLPNPCISNLTATVIQEPVAGNGSYLYWVPGTAATDSITIESPGTTSANGNGWVPDAGSTNGQDTFSISAMFNHGNSIMGSASLSYTSTYGTACMTNSGNTSEPVNVRVNSIAFVGMAENTTLNEIQFSAEAAIIVTDQATGATVCSFGAGAGPTLFVTAVDSKTAPPGYLGAQIYLSNGALYKSLTGSGPTGTVAIGGGQIMVHLK